MEKIAIVKIGCSVITYKAKSGTPTLRKKVLVQLARELSFYSGFKKEKIILVHGTGSFGHLLAKKYQLGNLQEKQKDKLGVALTRQSVQKLNSSLADIFLESGCPLFPLPPASLIRQKNGRIEFFDAEVIELLLTLGFIPVLHGDVVVDKNSQFSICSGDQIVSYLSNLFLAERAFFLTDVDGVFPYDPKQNPQAKVIKEIKRKKLPAIIAGIHNKSSFDVTNSMKGKLSEIADIKCDVDIFNGLIKGNFLKALKGKRVGTRIIS